MNSRLRVLGIQPGKRWRGYSRKSGGVIGRADSHLCEAETVVIGRKGSINRPAFVQEPFWNADTAFGLVANKEILMPKYLYYFCEYFDFEKLNTTVIPSLTKKKLYQIEISVPDLGAQKKIVEILDQVTILIDLREKELKKIDLMEKSRFLELFGDLAAPSCVYPKCPLIEACTNPKDIRHGPDIAEGYQSDGVAIWEMSQIKSGFAVKSTHFVFPQKAQQLKAYSLEPGDIVMARKGYVGKCGLFPKGIESGIMHSNVLRIRVDQSRVNPCFMLYQLLLSGAVQQQIKMISTGTVLQGITVKKLKQIEVCIPEYDLQQRFADFVDQTEKIKAVVLKSQNKLEILKKSLIQEYFGQK